MKRRTVVPVGKLMIVSALAMLNLGFGNDQLNGVANAQASSDELTSAAILDLLARSPGERGLTDLLKGRRQATIFGEIENVPADGAPKQRALGKIFDFPPEDGLAFTAGAPTDLLGLGTPPSISDLADFPAITATPASGVPSFSGTGPGAPPVGVIGGNPGGGGPAVPAPGAPDGPQPEPPVVTPTPPAGPGIPTPPVTSPVPEPGTWMLMLVGFIACGGALRRRGAMRVFGKDADSRCVG
jgi:hypothetical protein